MYNMKSQLRTFMAGQSEDMKLNRESVDQIHAHALEEYPEECCGIVTGNNSAQRVHRCENIQNRLHAEDPAAFPRDARIAYVIDRSEFDGIIRSALEKKEDVIAFYHSHPEHEAYFSEEDLAAQTVFGEPEFPDSLQIVVSVIERKIQETRCFQWDRDMKHFTARTNCF